MPLENTSRIVRNAKLQSSRVDNDIVILNMKTNNYVALDKIGRRVWELIETPVTVKDVCIQLRREFNAPEGRIETDVTAFFERLLAEDMASIVPN